MEISDRLAIPQVLRMSDSLKAVEPGCTDLSGKQSAGHDGLATGAEPGKTSPKPDKPGEKSRRQVNTSNDDNWYVRLKNVLFLHFY